MKSTQKLTEDQELYLKKVLTQLEEGSLPKQTAKAKHGKRKVNERDQPWKVEINFFT